MTAPAARPADPRKGLRGVGAGVLSLESFTVMFAMLAVFGMGNTDGHVAYWKLEVLGAVALALLVTGFLMKRPWGRAAGTGLQVVVLAAGIAVWPLLFVALLFGPMWAYYLHMWRQLELRLASVGSAG